MSRRYWLSLGTWSSFESGEEFYDQIAEELRKIDGVEGGTNGLVLKTNDLEEAQKARRVAMGVLQKYPALADYLNTGEECIMPITTQPQCPNCGDLARFSDSYCSKCGTELLGKGTL